MFACFADARKAAVQLFIFMTLIVVSACTVPDRVGVTENTGQTIVPGAPVQVALLIPGGSNAGSDRFLAANLENAARMAISDLVGVTIDLRVYNTGSDPLQAARVASAAVDDGAQIILGPLYGEAANAAGVSVVNRNVNVLAFSNNPTIAGGNVFILGSTFGNTANRLVQYAGRQGMNRYTVVHGTSVPGQLGRDAIANAIRANGAQVTAIEGYPLSQQGVTDSASRIIAAARNGGSDAIFYTGVPSGDGADLPFILDAVTAAGLTSEETKFIGLTRWDANAEIVTRPSAQGGIFAVPDQALKAAFESRYTAVYGEGPHPLAGLAYDGIAAIGALVAQGSSNALTKSSLTTAQGFQGTGGIFRFLPNGLNQRGLAIAEIRNNQVITLEQAPRSFGGSGL